MSGWRSWSAVVVAACVLLAGCDPQHIRALEEGVSTEADLRVVSTGSVSDPELTQGDRR